MTVPSANSLARLLVVSTLTAHSALAGTPQLLSASAPTPGASVKDWGAVGDGVADDTAAISTAITQLKQSNTYKTLFFPNGVYRITSPLPALNNGGFSMINISGENPYLTTIDGSALADGSPLLHSSGGSGQISNAEIKDLTLQGGGGETGVLIRGTGGVKINNCRLRKLGVGVEFSNNAGAGTFTEFSVANSCVFLSDCITAVRFVRGNGADSFHGSGLVDCTINNAAGNLGSPIVIGNPGEVINLYNAPLDFTIWTRESLEIVRIASPSSRISTTGALKIENMDTSKTPTICAAGNLFHTGPVLTWGQCHLGTLKQVHSVKFNGDGSVNADRTPYRTRQTLNTAANTIAEVTGNELGSLVNVMLTSNNYDFRYLLLITGDGFGAPAGYVNVLANPKNFNAAGIGAPAFSVNASGQLVITNVNYAGRAIDAKISTTPLGGRKEFFWQ